MLLYFLIGMVFAIIGVTLLQEISELISITFEYFKSKIGVKVVRNQKLMEEINDPPSSSPVNAIGFTYSPDEED